MSALQVRRGELLTSFVIGNLPKLFPDYHLHEKEKILGNRTVDLHLKDQEGNDLFVEIKAYEITKRQIGRIIDYHSAILNLEPQPKNPRFVIIAESVDENMRRQLEKMGISIKTYDELGIPIQGLLDKESRRRRRELTPTEAKLVAKWESKYDNDKKTSIISVETVCRELQCTRSYARTLLHRLERKRWLERVSRGVYTFIPAEYGYDNDERFPVMEPLIAGSRLVKPYYFSYTTTNSYYGFTTQMPSTYFIATTKKKPQYIWRNTAFQFVTLSKKKFFGFKEVNVNGVKVKMAEPEKAIVDSIDKIRYTGGIEEVIRVVCRGFNKIQRDKLVAYATKMGSHALSQRLGFILSFLDSKQLIDLPPAIKNSLLANVGKAPIYLAPNKPKQGSFSSEWRVVKNMSDKELLSEIEKA